MNLLVNVTGRDSLLAEKPNDRSLVILRSPKQKAEKDQTIDLNLKSTYGSTQLRFSFSGREIGII
jgi:hypothetical protein